MLKLLDIVAIGGDAIREGRLDDAYAIFGPGGEAEVDFEHRRSFGRTQGGVRAHWQDVYNHEDHEAYFDERPVDYDEAVEVRKTHLRETVARTARAEWKDPVRVSSFDEILKRYYTDDKLKEMAVVPNPFYDLIRKAT